MGVTLVGFIFVNIFINKKIETIVNTHNNEAVDKIKKIVGHKRFDELMDETRAHYDDFFGIVEDDNTEVLSGESLEENVVEEVETKEETEE